MSEEILFRTPCLNVSCEDNSNIIWRHEGCPSGSKEYISADAIVRCDYCGTKMELLFLTFDCKSGTNYKRIINGKTNLKKAINIFSSLFMGNEISADFLMKIKQGLIEQQKKYQ